MDVAVTNLDHQALFVRPLKLPEGWCWATLEDVADGPQYGWTASAAATGKVRLLRTTDISSGKLNWATVPFCSESPEDIEKYLLHDGDIVISRAGSVGKSFQVTAPLRAVFASYLIRFQPRMNGKYLHYFLQTHAYWVQIGERSAGIAVPNVNGSKLKSVRLPLAPLAEQRRIVARVDALFAEIAEGEAALAAARKGLDTFRRALLKAAVTGELTKDWRVDNPATETGHDVLARIAKHRAIAAQRARARRATGTKPIDNAALPELPEGWAWASLGEIGEIVGGATVDKKRKSTDPLTVPYLRVANVQRGHIDLSKVKFITVERTSAEKLRLIAGDLLLNEGGDRDKIGRGWVWDGTVPNMIHQNHVFRVRLHSDSLNPFFVSHYANEMGRRFFIEGGKQTTNLASISLSKISMLPVPLPPAAETAEILRRVSDALAAAADVLTVFDAEAADVARLKQSILKAAFEGRLVSQDAADESASALLARFAAKTAAVRASRGLARKSDA
jgi:type I restriction enzyme S subunit